MVFDQVIVTKTCCRLNQIVANPTVAAFPTTTLGGGSDRLFEVGRRKYFCFQNVLGYSWSCKYYNMKTNS
jgi:hypothetical protein